MTLQFETGTNGIDRATDQVMALFDITVERHDRSTFQKQGHFVPGMVDENGFRREWEGPNVYIGTLWHELKDAGGNVTSRSQVLRMLADTPQELRRVMSKNLKESFFAWWLAQTQQASVYESYRRANEEHVEFVRTLKGTYAMPDNAESMSTAALAQHLVHAYTVRAAQAEEMLGLSEKSLRRTTDDAQRKITELTKALPWWSRKKVGA